MTRATIRQRVFTFCDRFGLRVPILLSPMGGLNTPALAIAVANAGGLAGCSVLLMSPGQISAWVDELRRNTNGAFQLNNWIPDPAPKRDAAREAELREFLGQWGPAVAADAGDILPLDFSAQFTAMLDARPPIVSSIMGLYPPGLVREIKSRGIKWFASATTLTEAKQAEDAGADVIIAQGTEAGGHRGSFTADRAERSTIGLFSLLPAVVDAVRVPVVAAGGIADGRGVAAALMLGASAVQIGTGFLRCPEAGISSVWADALGRASPEDAILSRVFSGRLARTISTPYLEAATAPSAPVPASYPVQFGLTLPMRTAAAAANNIDQMAAWGGQSAGRARAVPAATLVSELWKEASLVFE
jgi:nitronate monooxygenase